jgi:hypothetical protein
VARSRCRRSRVSFSSGRLLTSTAVAHGLEERMRNSASLRGPLRQRCFDGARALLPIGHGLFLYGPYRRFGQHTSESNARFDSDLRAQDPEWGLRDLEAVAEAGLARGFMLAEVVENARQQLQPGVQA